METTPPPSSSIKGERPEEDANQELSSVNPDDTRSLIEIGWIIAGQLDAVDFRATEQARDASNEWLAESFPGFQWKMPLVSRDEIVRAQRVESVELLDYGVTERNLRHWDFTLVITPADLVSQYKNDALSVVSRSLQTAVISTARIDPLMYRSSMEESQRVSVMALRIRSLVIHLLGHLAGLEHDEDPESFMSGFETVEDLDKANRLSAGQLKQLQIGFDEVADRRLEEKTNVHLVSTPGFYLHAAWINRRPIAEAVWQAKPWQFPFRLSRLTTAAASAMLVLMITAEAWELGLSQPFPLLATLALSAILLTTLYVITKQRLFVRREHSRLSELTVVTNVSTFAIVLSGMTATFGFLAIATFVSGQLLFEPELVSSWAATSKGAAGFWHYGKLALFVASAGMFIGALGASFEQQHYFRHITHVDEEI